MTVLADQKPKNYLRRPNMVADIFKNFISPFLTLNSVNNPSKK